MIRKTIISVFLSAVILFSGAFTPISQASVVDDTIVAYSEASWAQAMLSGILSTSGAMFISPLAGIAGGVVAEGINNLAEWYAAGHTDQEILDEYNNYVTDLETDLGTTIIGSTADGPVVVMRLPVSVTVAPRNFSSVVTSESGAFDYSFTGTQTNRDGTPYVRIAAINFVIPFATSGSTYYILGADNFPSRSFEYGAGYYLKGSYAAGSTIPVSGMNYGGYTAYTDSSYFPASLSASGSVYGVFRMPEGQGIPTTQNIANDSRPATLTTPVGVRNPDNTYTIYNQNVVNETDNIFFNPVTNDTIPFVDWSFDYATRTYTLTLEDGSVVTVIYGDDCMTIIQGDQEYTVYYVIPSEEDPGVDPDDPGTDDGSGWAWLKGAWTAMMDKLSGILEAITDLELSPEINVDVEVGGEEQVTQESWFSDLLAKFGFLTSIHDIYTQLVADVTSDAATAAAVADGEVMLADVTNGHASVYAAERHGFYTAPELAISFGASDKYGVDWANIRALDLSWYAPHKETVDGILSGILWLSYLFLLIKRAPGIIRGAEMVTEDRIKIDDWRMRR